MLPHNFLGDWLLQANLIFKKPKIVIWGDSSVGNILIPQVREPGFNPQLPVITKCRVQCCSCVLPELRRWRWGDPVTCCRPV